MQSNDERFDLADNTLIMDSDSHRRIPARYRMAVPAYAVTYTDSDGTETVALVDRYTLEVFRRESRERIRLWLGNQRPPAHEQLGQLPPEVQRRLDDVMTR